MSYVWRQANLHLLRAPTTVLPSAIDNRLIFEFQSKLNLVFNQQLYVTIITVDFALVAIITVDRHCCVCSCEFTEYLEIASCRSWTSSRSLAQLVGTHRDCSLHRGIIAIAFAIRVRFIVVTFFKSALNRCNHSCNVHNHRGRISWFGEFIAIASHKSQNHRDCSWRIVDSWHLPFMNRGAIAIAFSKLWFSLRSLSANCSIITIALRKLQCHCNHSRQIAVWLLSLLANHGIRAIALTNCRASSQLLLTIRGIHRNHSR